MLFIGSDGKMCMVVSCIIKELKPAKRAINYHPPLEYRAEFFVSPVLFLSLSGYGIPLFYNTRPVSSNNPGNAIYRRQTDSVMDNLRSGHPME